MYYMRVNHLTTQDARIIDHVQQVYGIDPNAFEAVPYGTYYMNEDVMKALEEFNLRLRTHANDAKKV